MYVLRIIVYKYAYYLSINWLTYKLINDKYQSNYNMIFYNIIPDRIDNIEQPYNHIGAGFPDCDF